MTIQISIIGLGRIGTSLGLALREHKTEIVRVGHDIDMKTARQAEKMGAVDRVDINLPNAVRGADLVILALPVDQLRSTLEAIVPDLREGCVVMDTSPTKQAMIAWAEELLPPDRFYVGLTPVLSAHYLEDGEVGIDGAQADLFKDGMMAVVAPPQINEGALKMANDLSRLVGATPMFSDPMEIDGLMATAHLLPKLMAAALLRATLDQPGWRESRKLAGPAYAQATHAVKQAFGGADLAAEALHNRGNAIRLIDDAIRALEDIRGAIDAGGEESLAKDLGRLQDGRDQWVKARQTREWQKEDLPAGEIPDTGGIMDRLLGIRRPKARS